MTCYFRCGSESLHRPSVSAEVIRKSASTDSFVPCITEVSGEQLRTTPSSAMITSGRFVGRKRSFYTSVFIYFSGTIYIIQAVLDENLQNRISLGPLEMKYLYS